MTYELTQQSKIPRRQITNTDAHGLAGLRELAKLAGKTRLLWPLLKAHLAEQACHVLRTSLLAPGIARVLTEKSRSVTARMKQEDPLCSLFGRDSSKTGP